MTARALRGHCWRPNFQKRGMRCVTVWFLYCLSRGCACAHRGMPPVEEATRLSPSKPSGPPRTLLPISQPLRNLNEVLPARRSPGEVRVSDVGLSVGCLNIQTSFLLIY